MKLIFVNDRLFFGRPITSGVHVARLSALGLTPEAIPVSEGAVNTFAGLGHTVRHTDRASWVPGTTKGSGRSHPICQRAKSGFARRISAGTLCFFLCFLEFPATIRRRG